MINRRVASLVYLMNAMQGLKTKGSFIATQLNSTSSWVELRRQSVYSDADATQLDIELSTRSQRDEQLSPISSERRDPVRVSTATQLDVELSCVGEESTPTSSWVELRRYKRAFRGHWKS